jgi:hypothetical protein
MELKRAVIGTLIFIVTNHSHLKEYHPVRFLPFSIYKW